MVFAFFAEDVGLLSAGLVTRLLDKTRAEPERFSKLIGQLFTAMADGGDFGIETIRRFNGNLFDSGEVLELTRQEIEALYRAAKLDWGAVDPSIFGTLFERGMDPDKRSQLGAHYTSREDIETLVEPVVMTPLRRQWTETRRLVDNLLATGKKHPKGTEKPPAGRVLAKAHEEAIRQVRRFLENLAHLKVLDPACGSGNFLYVTLQKLKDLEKQAIVYAQDRLATSFIPLVGPWQLYGIEINPYAHELAQMTVWIGYLQWVRSNGFGVTEDPVLRRMDNFQCKDAILDLSDPDNPKEPEWPAVDFIVGNPPFLGDKLMRSVLGDDYAAALRTHYRDRVPAAADLCCYWLERGRVALAGGPCSPGRSAGDARVARRRQQEGLAALKQSGDIFFAESDRPWVLDGANVHVSMIGYDAGIETERFLDGKPVAQIHPDLTALTNVTIAKRLPTSHGLSFQGPVKVGSFELTDQAAREILLTPNPQGLPSSDVVRPWANGVSLTSRVEPAWIIDFEERSLEEAASYGAAFHRVELLVRPQREHVKRDRRRIFWWIHGETNNALRRSLDPLTRYLATCQTAKHRFYVWLPSLVLPAQTVIAFARSDDFFFGVLHSRVHEVWSLKLGTRLETRPSYTPTTCFETFPFPHPTPDQESAIAAAAKELDTLRSAWLNPPEWTREEVLEFPGSADGPWARYVHDPDARGIGSVRYPRLVARDDDCAAKLKKRTLTQLYNQRPTWLDLAHRRLDEAVFAAYGWPADLGDEEILERLLALNLQRAAEERAGEA